MDSYHDAFTRASAPEVKSNGLWHYHRPGGTEPATSSTLLTVERPLSKELPNPSMARTQTTGNTSISTLSTFPMGRGEFQFPVSLHFQQQQQTPSLF